MCANTVACLSLDSISSRFNVLNTPISTTAPIDAKTNAWSNRWQCTITNQRSLLGHIQAKIWDVFLLAAGYYEHSVNNYKCVIDTHKILLRVVRSIQNSKYSTQNQHFAKMFTYSGNTNYNLNFYYFTVSIYLRFHLFGNYSCVWCQCHDPDGIFACRVQRPLSTKHPEFALSVAVVDTRSLAGARGV
jgi:hypothetical protein